MKKKIDSEDTPISDWNMGVKFYEILSNLKEAHIDAFISQEYGIAVECLSNEIDWVSSDIGPEKLKELRRRIDSIEQTIFNGVKGKTSRNNIRMRIKKVKRDLWDAELKAKILRPRDDTDLSHLPMAVINQR